MSLKSICDGMGIADIEQPAVKTKMEKETVLFGVRVLHSYNFAEAKKYLGQHCTIDVLDDTLYVKKLGNDKTTFAIDFFFDEIDTIRKIKDEDGNNVKETVYESQPE